jgi:hypothetical protein
VLFDERPIDGVLRDRFHCASPPGFIQQDRVIPGIDSVAVQFTEEISVILSDKPCPDAEKLALIGSRS